MSEAFPIDTIMLDGTELTVAVAATGDLRSQGLMGVSTLGDLDGMVFVFDTEAERNFWMWTVPISLDIAFFASDGSLVGVLEMAPCVDGDSADCPRYGPGEPFRYALETVAGDLNDLAPTAELAGLGG